jgi:hypothetical protein
MKLSLATAALTLSTASASTLRKGTGRNLQETACYEGRNLNLIIESADDNACSYAGVVEQLQEKIDGWARCNNSAETELDLLLGEDAENQIDELCHEANLNWKETTGMDFGQVTNKGDLFDKEYFDGGTYINEERETIEDGVTKYNLQDDVGRINNLYDGAASKKYIGFPDNLSNFDSCEYGAAFCCWIQDRQAGDNNGNCATPYDDNCVNADPGDNTDVCSVDISRAPDSAYVPAGTIEFPGDSEGDVHCHGFAWADDDDDTSSILKGNNLFYVSLYDHLSQRGYVRNVPGAPMCGCAEQMPIVSRADCTEIEWTRRYKVSYGGALGAGFSVKILGGSEIAFNACQGANDTNNDLEAYYERLVEEEKRTAEELASLQETIVGDC